jgi:hypothetical protein
MLSPPAGGFLYPKGSVKFRLHNFPLGKEKRIIFWGEYIENGSCVLNKMLYIMCSVVLNTRKSVINIY